MLKVGLTGGIASGKTVVGKMLVDLGARLIQADEIAHQLMRPGESVYKQVVQHFGEGILNPDGIINRGRLAEAAFSSAANQPSRIAELNQIVHPAVIRRQEEWMEEVGRDNPQAIAIVEAALILEAGVSNRFDRLIVVTCNPEQRIERWAARVKVDLDTARREVTRRMAAQFPDQQKIDAADYEIDNSGSLNQTLKRVRAIFPELQREAENIP